MGALVLDAWLYCVSCDGWFYEASTACSSCPSCSGPVISAVDPTSPVPPEALVP